MFFLALTLYSFSAIAQEISNAKLDTTAYSNTNPWAHISLVGEVMKPGYPFAINKRPFPLLPVIGGVMGGGALIYIITDGEDKEECSFSTSHQVSHSVCGEMTGSAEIAINPTGDYIFAWSSGQPTSFITGLEAGNYTVTITARGTDCSQIVDITIDDESKLIENSVITTNADCGLDNGIATIENPSFNQTYEWSSGIIGTSVLDLGDGNYTVTITEGTCSSIIEFVIQENETVIDIVGELLEPNCGGQDGSILVTISPAGNYDYSWSTGETSSSLTSIGSGNYEVTVTDLMTNCTQTKSFTLEDKAADFQLTFSSNDATCGKENGSIEVQVDSPGSYSYLWSNGAVTQSITDLKDGEYDVTVTLLNSECSVVSSGSVNIFPIQLDISFTNTHTHCGLMDGAISTNVNPKDNYTYLWSNGQTQQDISMLDEGTYTLTVTDQNGCAASGTTNLITEEIIYIENIIATSGDCVLGGEISITLFTPGDGPINTIISGPTNQETFILDSGTHEISNLTTIIPGNYTIEVFDVNAGIDCSQTVNIEVEDNSILLSAVDDFYETIATESVQANVLENDQGIQISFSSNFDVFGGLVNIDNEGDFEFIPFIDFSGEASFNYVILDACEKYDTAKVVINVKPAECNFSTQFDISAADCGLEDGSAIVTVDPPGNYSYVWSNGISGPILEMVGLGTYDVSITDIDLGCQLIFDLSIPDNSPSYISNMNVIQPTCNTQGSIHFDLNSSSNAGFIVIVSHTFGTEEFFIPDGLVLLEDYIDIIPGDYSISVFDIVAGESCTETYDVLIEEPTILTIADIQIFSPSSDSESDGAIIMQITEPGIPPYTIWINGVFWGVTTDVDFILPGLGVGEYEIYLIDAANCISNTVSVFIPPPNILSLEIGANLINLRNIDQSPEAIFVENKVKCTPFYGLTARYKYLGISNTTSLRIMRYDNLSSYAFRHFINLGSVKFGPVKYSLRGGGQLTQNHEGLYDFMYLAELLGEVLLYGPWSVKADISKSQSEDEFIRVGIGLNRSIGLTERNRSLNNVGVRF